MGSYKSSWMDDELGIFRSSVRRFVREEFVPHEKRWREQHHIDRDAQFPQPNANRAWHNERKVRLRPKLRRHVRSRRMRF